VLRTVVNAVSHGIEGHPFVEWHTIIQLILMLTAPTAHLDLIQGTNNVVVVLLVKDSPPVQRLTFVDLAIQCRVDCFYMGIEHPQGEGRF